MRIAALLFTVVMAASLAAQDKPKVEASEKIKELQKERIATLKEVVDLLTTRFQSAQVEYVEVFEAQMQLFQAELDATQKDLDRIAIYKKTIDVLKASEELAKARLQAARGSMAAVLKIKARRLEVEILLEQAKMKDVAGLPAQNVGPRSK